MILSAEEYARLLDGCGDDAMLRTYLIVLAETGARAESEALQLRWEDVDFAGGFVHIMSGSHGRRTKSGKSRWTPMTPALADALRDHAANYRLAQYGGERSPWLFHHTVTGRRSVAGSRVRWMRKRFDRAVRAANLPDGFRPHDLRHRRVTVWLAEGASPALVQEAMGHADITTTMGYKHLAREHLRALVEPNGQSQAKDGAEKARPSRPAAAS